MSVRHKQQPVANHPSILTYWVPKLKEQENSELRGKSGRSDESNTGLCLPFVAAGYCVEYVT